MTQSWRPDPSFKVETNGSEFKDVSTIQVTRPENNISFAVLSVDDYKSKSYEGVFDALNSLDISFRYGSDSWTKVFSGTISTVKPHLSAQGEILEVSGWGKGNALVKTHCNTSYGKESQNPTKALISEIWPHLIVNYVNKSFGSGNTGWALTYDEWTLSNPSVTFLNGSYKSCFEILNILCDLRQAYQGSSEGIHFYVDVNGRLKVKNINADGYLGNWKNWWRTDQAGSTIEVTKDMILYDFRKNVEEYANKIVLCSALRKPGYDYITEDAVANNLWGSQDATLTDDTATKVVGSNSLRIQPSGAVNPAIAWYPSGKDAAWDLTNVGSKQTIPTLNFYARRTSGFTIGMRLCTDATHYVNINVNDVLTATDEFFHLTFPVGPYFALSDEARRYRYVDNNVDWSDIHYVQFTVGGGSTDHKFRLDDFHFAGKIIREAYDSTAIGNNKEYQRVIRNDTALDDSMKAADDSGTAARLAYAELLRRKQTPIVGIIQIPGAIDLLPGQLVYVKACKKSDGTFRIEKNFRVVELKHIFVSERLGLTTILNLTDDVNNTHAFGAPTAHSLLMEYVGALRHAEAKNLKGGGIDILISRLSKDYPS